MPVRSASITISSGMSSASQLTESTGDRGDAEKVSAKLPITDRISLNAAYDLNKSSGSLKLSYTFHTLGLRVRMKVSLSDCLAIREPVRTPRYRRIWQG